VVGPVPPGTIMTRCDFSVRGPAVLVKSHPTRVNYASSEPECELVSFDIAIASQGYITVDIDYDHELLIISDVQLHSLPSNGDAATIRTTV
jgi:hypothetical protein